MMYLVLKGKKGEYILMCFMPRKSNDETKVNELMLTTPDGHNVFISHLPQLGSSKPVLVRC